MTYIPSALRDLVIERAGGRCEYCLYPQAASYLAFEMEHIIAEKHGGTTSSDNLALACPYCNRAKGSDIASLDPETKQLTPFFNPRTQNWSTHFSLVGSEIMPLTAIGRVTVYIFQMNHHIRIQERAALIAGGQYP